MAKINYYDNFEGKINNNLWSLDRINKNSWEITDEILKIGKKSLKITVREGDKKEIGNDGKDTERAEFSEKPEIYNKLNSPILYSFSFYFPKDFYITSNRLVFAQWKQITLESRSPFLSFRYQNKELIFQVVHYDKRIKFRKKIDLRGKWHNIKIHYQLNDNQTGFAKVWFDKVLFADYKGAMGYNYFKPFIKFKMGLYRDRIKIPQTIYLDEFERVSNNKL